MILRLLRYSILILLVTSVWAEESPKETNKKIIKAEEKYKQRMAEIVAEALKQSEKAKADLVKTMERELSTATKKGDFDEAMRLKAKLELAKKDDQVSGLFGDVDLPKKDKKAAELTSKSLIKIHSIWCGGSVPAEKVKLISDEIIDSKTNSVKFVPKTVVKMLESEVPTLSVNFLSNGAYISVVAGPRDGRNVKVFGEMAMMNEDKFSIRYDVHINDEQKLTRETALEDFLKLKKDEK